MPEAPTTTLTVDLAAVVANYRLLAGKAPNAEAAAVVKADAYGLGAAAVSRALAAAGCRTFFVALAHEGAALRSLLPDARIAVLNGATPGDAAALLDHGLVPVLNSLDQAAAFAAAAPADTEVMLHVDTGMNRLGLPAAEVDRLAADRTLLGDLRVSTLLSHFACADDPDAAQNRDQLAAVAANKARLAPVLGDVAVSIANSAAILHGPDFHADLLRPGAALYGLTPLTNRPNPMQQVIEYKAKILQVRDVDSDMTVGYGATHRVTRGGRVATIAVGYADGFPRSLGNRGSAFIGDMRAPIVGRVSMDLTTLDVSAIPHACPGAMAEVVGPRLPPDEVAAAAGTIGYEILTNIGRRTPRTYVGAP